MRSKSDVLIVLPYVNHYRVKLLTLLEEQLQLRGVAISVASSSPIGDDLGRQDRATYASEPLKQIVLRLGTRSLRLRALPKRWFSSDLVIVEHATKNLDTYAILILRRLFGRPTALWGHGATITTRTSRVTRALQRLMVNLASWYFAYTEGSALRAASLGAKSTRITVLYNAIDTRALQAAVQERISGARSSATLLYVGGIDASKRIELLVRVGEELHKREASFKLIVGGRGDQASWLESIDRPWLDYRGLMNTADKARAGAEASAMIITGRVGLAVCDAFALGLPVLAPRWEFHAPEFEYLNESNAVLTEDDFQALVDAALALLADHSRLFELQAGATASAEMYTVEGMASRFSEGVLHAISRLKDS